MTKNHTPNTINTILNNASAELELAYAKAYKQQGGESQLTEYLYQIDRLLFKAQLEARKLDKSS